LCFCCCCCCDDDGNRRSRLHHGGESVYLYVESPTLQPVGYLRWIDTDVGTYISPSSQYLPTNSAPPRTGDAPAEESCADGSHPDLCGRPRESSGGKQIRGQSFLLCSRALSGLFGACQHQKKDTKGSLNARSGKVAPATDELSAQPCLLAWVGVGCGFQLECRLRKPVLLGPSWDARLICLNEMDGVLFFSLSAPRWFAPPSN